MQCKLCRNYPLNWVSFSAYGDSDSHRFVWLHNTRARILDVNYLKGNKRLLLTAGASKRIFIGQHGASSKVEDDYRGGHHVGDGNYPIRKHFFWPVICC